MQGKVKAGSEALLHWIANRLPDRLIGEPAYLEERIRSQYGRKDDRAAAWRIRKRNTTYYLAAAALFLIVVIGILLSVGNSGEPLGCIERPVFGEVPVVRHVVAELSQGGKTLEQDIRLRVAAAALSDEEVDRLVSTLLRELPDRIKGQNPDLDHVSSDLALPTELMNGAVRLRWTSDRPDWIDELGKLDCLAVAGGGTVQLRAQVELAGTRRHIALPATLGRPDESIDPAPALLKRLEESVRALEDDLSGKKVRLPDSLPDGVKVNWREPSAEPPFPALLLIAGLFPLIYFTRYRQLDREASAHKIRLDRELPDFIDKLTLLIHAGLTSDSALRRIAADYARRRKLYGESPLYESLAEIDRRIGQANSSVMRELRLFARSSGSRELMRFTAIFDDNIDKGSALTDKLEAEAEWLWVSRKKHAEEAGRLAETRLAFPLMLLLLALILITVAPVMLKM